MKCITFDLEAQRNLSEETKAKMKAAMDMSIDPNATCYICKRSNVDTSVIYRMKKVCSDCNRKLLDETSENGKYYEELERKLNQ